eukprot:656038-Lingulodinium_polyedra.AAC.1
MAGEKRLDDDSDVEMEAAAAEAAFVGMPHDSEYQRVKRRRENKVVKWVSDPLTRPCLLLWLLVCLQVLHLHYALFRDAKAGLGNGLRIEDPTPSSE